MFLEQRYRVTYTVTQKELMYPILYIICKLIKKNIFRSILQYTSDIKPKKLRFIFNDPSITKNIRLLQIKFCIIF